MVDELLAEVKAVFSFADLFASFLKLLISFINILPISPVRSFVNEYLVADTKVGLVLGYLNYFLPIGKMFSISFTWATIMFLVGAFYSIKRFLNK